MSSPFEREAEEIGRAARADFDRGVAPSDIVRKLEGRGFGFIFLIAVARYGFGIQLREAKSAGVYFRGGRLVDFAGFDAYIREHVRGG